MISACRQALSVHPRSVAGAGTTRDVRSAQPAVMIFVRRTWQGLTCRGLPGQSELLDEIVAAKPKMEHKTYHSVEELKDTRLQHLRAAVAVLESRATPEEVDEYRRFILTLANKVAAAHREEGQDVSPAEAAAIDQIAGALGTTEAPTSGADFSE